MDPSEGFMGSVLSKFSRLLALEFGPLEFSLPGDTDQLIRAGVYPDLRRIRAYYCSDIDARMYELTNERWGTRIIAMFYSADNLADSILVHTEHSETAANKEGFNRLLLKERDTLLNLFSPINVGTELLLGMIRHREGSGLPFEKLPDQLVGIENPRDVLINMLAQGDDMSEPKRQMKVVSIVGNGGLGKTTLARVVYDQIKPQFECAAFVRAPLITDGKVGFLKEMIFKLGVENNMDVSGEESEDAKKLIDYIGSFLQNKRYLVVIDNLWDEDDWPTISRVLPNNDYGSRVITTTRMKHIAELCCSGYDELIYEIQRLGYLDSKFLFLKQTFGFEVSCLNTSTDGFNEILKMCGGTLSSIIGIATSLRTKVTATKPWQELMNSIRCAWKQTPTVDVNIPGFEELEDIVRITYFDLPITLKDCLLYLAVHAKNGIIYRTTTVRKWIAEGFISEFGRSTAEEVASRYFDEFISRNYIQLVDGTYIGKEIYKLNYVVMYVLRQISEKINFGTVLSDISISSEYKHSLRLSIQCSGSELSVRTENMDLNEIRSITMAGPAKLRLTNDLMYLRVLDLDGCKDFNNSSMYYICRMILLKYLSLKHTQVTEIPPEIRMLRWLETLDVRHSEVSNVSPEIGKLQNLETLDASRTRISNLPPEIGKLQALKILDASHTHISCVPREIGKLQNLETLDVRQTQVEELPKEIVHLPKLAHLYFGQISPPRGVKLPAGSDQLKSVEALGTVDSREWSASAMEEISGLTGVREIEIVLHDRPADKEHNNKLLSSIGECENLKYLIIYGDHNPSDDLLKSPCFPLLERLKVAGRFMKVPRWIAQLTTLKKLDARVCKLDQEDLKILGGLPVLSTLALELICIPWKKEVTITNGMKSSTSTDQSPAEETSPAGFMSLEVFNFDCRVPWITFEQGAMPRLKQLHLKLYNCPGDKLPSGLNNLDSLEKIILQYASVYASSGGVTKVVAAMREEASSHHNMIGLSVNGYHEVFLPNTRVGETLTGTEIEEASNQIKLSVNADHEVLLSNARVDETITGTEIEE